MAAGAPLTEQQRAFLRGLRDSVPIFLIVGGFGTVFGVLGSQLGGPPWLPVAMSVLVISGAAQFAMVALWGAGTLPLLIAVTGLALRHLPMGLRLSEVIGPQRLSMRLALSYVLVDETFGMTLLADERGQPEPAFYKLGADLNLMVSWIGGTALGVWLGTSFDPSAIGADVMFAVLFLALAAPLLRSRKHVTIAIVAAGLAVIAIPVLPSAWEITGAAFAAAIVGAAFHD